MATALMEDSKAPGTVEKRFSLPGHDTAPVPHGRPPVVAGMAEERLARDGAIDSKEQGEDQD